MNLQSSSTQTSINIKTLTRNLTCLLKSISKAKSNFFQILRKNKPIKFLFSKKKKNKKTFFGSFRLHYNWCSSRVMNVPENVFQNCDFDSRAQFEEQDESEMKLCGYLQWLEEKKAGETPAKEQSEVDMNEIDKLAEMFIARNHEKFRLEKQESYRRFQELMIASSS